MGRNTSNDDSAIDFVITWVDGNDRQWQEKKHRYASERECDVSDNRYRDWGFLLYWFRGVAKYAPWVRKIHFVSDAQIPEWLDINNPKIHIVDHRSYIPSDCLPLFNSGAIEIGMNNISGLAENFVYFNDDVLLTSPVGKEYFFKDDLPVDFACFTTSLNKGDQNFYRRMMRGQYEVLNRHFNKKEVLMTNFSKWFNLSYGRMLLWSLVNLDIRNKEKFYGIATAHLSMPLKKSHMDKIWTMEHDRLVAAQHDRFREITSLSIWLCRFWRLCDGEFFPRGPKGKYIELKNVKSVEKAINTMEKKKLPEVCLNDCFSGSNIDFEISKQKITGFLGKMLPEKCEFEA